MCRLGDQRGSFSTMTIKQRLVSVLTAIGLILLGTAALGNFALHWSHSSLKTVYEDWVVCLRQFSIIRDAYDDIIDVSRMLRSKNIAFSVAKEKIERDLSNLHTQWSAYQATC